VAVLLYEEEYGLGVDESTELVDIAGGGGALA
jgi:hypothetical protein